MTCLLLYLNVRLDYPALLEILTLVMMIPVSFGFCFGLMFGYEYLASRWANGKINPA